MGRDSKHVQDYKTKNAGLGLTISNKLAKGVGKG
jgi:hypothetical protein